MNPSRRRWLVHQWVFNSRCFHWFVWSRGEHNKWRRPQGRSTTTLSLSSIKANHAHYDRGFTVQALHTHSLQKLVEQRGPPSTSFPRIEVHLSLQVVLLSDTTTSTSFVQSTTDVCVMSHAVSVAHPPAAHLWIAAFALPRAPGRPRRSVCNACHRIEGGGPSRAGQLLHVDMLARQVCPVSVRRTRAAPPCTSR